VLYTLVVLCVGANPTTKPRKMSILAAHWMLGHKSGESTRQTAKALGITIMRGSMPVCKACVLSKVKQMNVPKKSTSEPVTRPFERVHMDISQMKVLVLNIAITLDLLIST
jgi:hypothetical protein